MTGMLDGNTAALRDHENKEMARDRSFDVYEARAREMLDEDLRVYATDASTLMNNPSIVWVFEKMAEDLAAAFGEDYQAFLKAMSSGNTDDLGLLVDKAVDRTIENIKDGDTGQDIIERNVETLEQEQSE